jgi:hypothetical protein
VDRHPTLTCNPPSGSLFPLGQTTVVCNAHDADGNASQITFTVTVTDQPLVGLAMEEIYGSESITHYENRLTLANTQTPVKAISYRVSFEPAGYIDTSLLSVAATGRAVNHTAFGQLQADGTYKILLLSFSGDVITTGSAPILTLGYELLPEAPYGSDIYMNILDAQVADADSDPLPVDASPGVHHHWIPGDVQGDGDYDLFDVLLSIDIFLTSEPDPTYHQEDASDADRDGNVDLFDLLRLVDLFLNPSQGGSKAAVSSSAATIGGLMTQWKTEMQLRSNPLVEGYMQGDPDAPPDLPSLMDALEDRHP